MTSIRSALCLLGAVGLITPGCGSGKEVAATVSATPRSQPLASAEEIIERSLMITDPSVVDSPAASSRLDDPSSTGLGVFSFAHMMQSLAGSQNASAFAETFLTQLATRQVVNGFVTEPTLSAVRSAPENNEPLTALNRWCRTSDGQLDLSRAPFRLLAIVNRPDLRSSSEDVGELRFIYSLLLTDDACQTSQSPGVLPVVQSGTGVAVIFEFAQPAASCSAAHALAGQWQALADLGFGAGYNAALQTLTEGVLGLRTSARPNGSQLNHVRVNSGKSPSEWTLREFMLGGRTPNSTNENQLQLVSPAGAPDFSTFNDSSDLRVFISQNQASITNGTFMLKATPDLFQGKAFGGAQSGLLDQWSNQGLRDSTFSFMTCGGCHSHQANGPHVGVNAPFPALVGRDVGQRARLSAFMLSFDGTDGELPARVKTLREIADSPTCATVDAFTVLSANAPRDASPGDALVINAISRPVAAEARQLRLYRVGDSITATPISTVNIDAPAGPEWTLCAGEGGTCTFSGTKTVRYGAGTSFVTRVVTSGTPCTNAVFGDPIWGVVKSCWFDSSVATPPPPTDNWVACAGENEFCAFSGTRRVRYGAEPNYSILTITNGTACTNGVFGDPIWGIVKSCWFEGDVALSGTQLVTLSLQVPSAPGSYEVRSYAGSTLTATSRPVNVDVNHRFGLGSSTFVSAASALSVFWSAPTDHSPNDTIGVYAQNADNGSPINTVVTGAGTGTDNLTVNALVTLTMPNQPGLYELRMFRAPSNVLVATELVTVH